MFSVLGEERTRIRKKKKKEKKGKQENKKEKKKLIADNSGLVGIKKCLKTYNHVKYFVVLMPLLNKICFYAKLLGEFLGPNNQSHETYCLKI